MAQPGEIGTAGTGVPEATLDREIELVRIAIDTVASGAAPRVTLAGLRFGEHLAGLAAAWARQAGVGARPLWSADESGADIVIEPNRFEDGLQ